MPFTFEIDAEHRLVLAVVVGAAPLSVIRAYRNELRASPAFDPTFNQLVDVRRGTLLPAYADVRAMAAEDPFTSGVLRAILVPDEVHYGITRAYGGILDSAELLHPFRTVEEAAAFLGVSADWLDSRLKSLAP